MRDVVQQKFLKTGNRPHSETSKFRIRKNLRASYFRHPAQLFDCSFEGKRETLDSFEVIVRYIQGGFDEIFLRERTNDVAPFHFLRRVVMRFRISWRSPSQSLLLSVRPD